MALEPWTAPGLIVAGAEGKRLTYKQPGLTSLLWRVYAVVTVPRRAAVA